MHVGIDLAWGPRGRTGLTIVDADGRYVDSAAVRTDGEIDGWLADRALVTVAIDAPLIVCNPIGMREAERALSKDYATFHAGTHPTNLGTRHMNPPRGGRLAARHGWSLNPWPPATAEQTVAIEVYPHAAMVGLFGLPRIVRYKRKRHRTPADRRSGFEQVLELFEGIETLQLPRQDRWRQIRSLVAATTSHADLGQLEDEIDAILCAHLAWLWHTHRDRLRVYGDWEWGAIIAPPPPLRPPPRSGI
ncbi:DUF429 domain-containing protein [uncultured Amnibacterium sp.]|uniref:DUF429 domain-containing protein n=1 Tax=uncultured Amnibacterium sp. TaxID=1631851 RepID=UPI0035CCA7A4